MLAVAATGKEAFTASITRRFVVLPAVIAVLFAVHLLGISAFLRCNGDAQQQVN
jgi:hypothetical protein